MGRSWTTALLWRCGDTLQWTYPDFLGAGLFTPLPPLGTPCAVPTSFRHPSDCSTFLFLFLPVITVIPGSPWSREAGCDTDLVLRFYISCLSVRVSWDTYHCKMPEWITLLAHSTHEHTGGIFFPCHNEIIMSVILRLHGYYRLLLTNTLLHSF